MSNPPGDHAIPVPPSDVPFEMAAEHVLEPIPNYGFPAQSHADGVHYNDVTTPIIRYNPNPDDYVCRFQIGVADGTLYCFPGVFSYSDAEEKFWSPIWPTMAGQPLGPLDGDTITVAQQPVTTDHAYAVLVYSPGGTGAEVLIMTNEEYGQLVSDYPDHFKFIIANFTLQLIPVEVGIGPTGIPIIENRIEATFMDQRICSDIDLYSCCEEESSGSDDPGSGSSKDSAIVPVHWSPTGYTALYCVESPDVRFEDTFIVERPKGARTWDYRISGKFRSVLADNTMEVVSLTGDKPGPVGVTIDEEGVCTFNTSMLPWNRPNRIVIRVTGIRRGFKGVRFEYKTKEEFELNEKRLNLDTYTANTNVL